MGTLDSSRVAILEKFLELGRSRDMAALETMITEDLQIQQAQRRLQRVHMNPCVLYHKKD